MRIHKEGIWIIFICFALLLLLIGGLYLIFPTALILHAIFSSFCFIVFVLIVRFFRNPDRSINPNDDVVISPADGTIVIIEETTENEYLKERCIQVSIFMSIFNVHVNRFPVSGEVIYYKYHPGKYLVANLPKSSTDNERNTSVIRTGKGKNVLVRQIAGAVARRIVSYVVPNTSVVQGQELGFIRFGSRVDLFLPLDCRINVKLGEKVCGNKTVIAKF